MIPSELESKVLQHFPNATDAHYTVSHYQHLLKKDHGFDFNKTLVATSLCADDANFSEDLDSVMSRPFVMGGLGGLPYTGFTGMVAYAHHIPDNGYSFIFYGPHVGITDEGELGKMKRPGQKHYSNSCGALMLALDRILHEDDDDVYVPISSEIDYQQTMLERTIMPFKHDLSQSDNPIKLVTEITYNNIHKFIKKYVAMAKNEFHCEKVALLGGIIINTSPEYDEFFDVRNFEVINIKDLKAPKIEGLDHYQSFKDL